MLKQEMGWYDREKNNTGALCARLSTSAEVRLSGPPMLKYSFVIFHFNFSQAVSGGTGFKTGQVYPNVFMCSI